MLRQPTRDATRKTTKADDAMACHLGKDAKRRIRHENALLPTQDFIHKEPISGDSIMSIAPSSVHQDKGPCPNKQRPPSSSCCPSCRFAEPSTDASALLTLARKIDEKASLALERLGAASPKGLMTVKEAANFLSISERTIRQQLADRQWPGYRCGTAVRVDPLEIKARMKRVPSARRASRAFPRQRDGTP